MDGKSSAPSLVLIENLGSPQAAPPISGVRGYGVRWSSSKAESAACLGGQIINPIASRTGVWILIDRNLAANKFLKTPQMSLQPLVQFFSTDFVSGCSGDDTV